jgi:hypothetical protein
MRLGNLGGIALGLAVSITTATALAETTPTGVELGLRMGYSVPLGNSTGGANGGPAADLSDSVNGVFPIWFDAGYRFNKNMFVGANFQYGVGFVNTDKSAACKLGGVSCTASDLMFGIDFHYHFMPDGVFDPWAGIGLGYEIFNVDESTNGVSTSVSLNGFQFLNLQLGGDYKAMPNLGIGPFVMFSLGQFSNCSATFLGMNVQSCNIPNTAVHEWLTIGVRGAYDIIGGG